MQVTATGIEADFGNNGINLLIKDTAGKMVGTLKIGRARVEWWPAWRKKSHKWMRLEDFIADHLEAMPERERG